MMKKSLDEIISYRRSIRVFKAEFPPIEDIKKIIRAGPLAPYADAAVGDVKDIRKFFIIRKNSKTLQKNPSLMKIGTSFLKRLEMVKNQGVPGVGTAPYYIIIAERKGIPQVEQQSLAHCLQNMWLKSTELGLGFHLVSMTAEMIRNKEF
jgi:nitroreductase